MAEPLPPPKVSPDVYTEAYYRENCAGSAEWTASEGAEVAGIYPGMLAAARFAPGMVVVDVGTGRGELLAVAVQQGAERAIGIEYSPAAIGLAQTTIDAHGAGGKAEVLSADARALTLDDGVADLVTMLDVVEHLAPEELDRSLAEAHRVLKPGGRVFVHTMPNRTVYDVTYRVQRHLRPGRARRWPKDPRPHRLEHVMHVNEQTVTSLKRALRRAGFRPAKAWTGAWLYTEFVPEERARRLYRVLTRLPVIRRLGAGDVYGEGTKPG
jgi:cyclopropane fatty-acyl-phospholipid synthase-like methyltransferase